MRSLAGHLIHIVTLVKHAIGAHLGRQASLRPHVPIGLRNVPETPRLPPPAPPPVPKEAWILLWHRVHRIGQRFLALHDRWQRGTLPTPRPRPGRTRPTPENRPPRPRLPRAFGWANKRIPEAAPASGTLEDLVVNRAAELRPFLQAAPQAGRLLRPLCHALGIPLTPELRLPPRPRQPRAPKPPRPRRPSLNDPRHKWRPWEKRAVRGFLKKFGKD